jgi:hypothetical protein
LQENIKIGDVCRSSAGRDKNTNYLVIEVDNHTALVVDGRERKVGKPKKKNTKHLKKLQAESLFFVAEQMRNGFVGNERLFRLIKQSANKNKED